MRHPQNSVNNQMQCPYNNDSYPESIGVKWSDNAHENCGHPNICDSTTLSDSSAQNPTESQQVVPHKCRHFPQPSGKRSGFILREPLRNWTHRNKKLILTVASWNLLCPSLPNPCWILLHTVPLPRRRGSLFSLWLSIRVKTGANRSSRIREANERASKKLNQWM